MNEENKQARIQDLDEYFAKIEKHNACALWQEWEELHLAQQPKPFNESETIKESLEELKKELRFNA